MNKLQKLREEYAGAGLTRDTVNQDPFEQFKLWFDQARDAGIPEPNAMSLATASITSAPSQRTVLIKDFDQNGFVFFTNHGSRKARQIQENAAVSALLPWYALQRQVKIEGHVGRISEDESRKYFYSRPRKSQVGAWASRQSEVLTSRHELDARFTRISEQFRGQEIPLPEFWGGYCIQPHWLEFLQGRTHRLHDRILYTRNEGSGWDISRLSP